MDRETLTPRLILAAVLLLGAGIRAYGLDHGLPEVYEEATPVRQAWEMWEWEGKGLDLNPHFFNYPSLIFYVQFVGQAAYFWVNYALGSFRSLTDLHQSYVSDPTALVLLARGITAFFGIVTVGAVFLLGRRLGGPVTGAVGALLLAVAPVHVATSRIVIVDVPLAMFCVLALHSLSAFAESGSRRDALLAGLWIGLATSSKYTGALLVVPYIAASFLVCRNGGGRPLSVLRRADLWWGGGAAAIAFLATSPYCLLDFGAFWADFSYERVHMAVGHFGRDPAAGPAAYLSTIVGNVGLAFAAFLVFGLATVLITPSHRASWAPALLFVLCYTCILLTWRTFAAYYLVPVLPILAILAGAGLVWAADALGRRWRRLPGWLPAAAAVVCAVPPASASLDRIHAQLLPDPRTQAKAWLEANARPGSTIALEFHSVEIDGSGFTLLYLPMLVTHPEASAPYYRAGWYGAFDYVVTSSAVSSRYEADPERFGTQVAFYESLEEDWRTAGRFSREQSGVPTITIYENPFGESGARGYPLPDSLLEGLKGRNADLARVFLGSLGRALEEGGLSGKAAHVHAWTSLLLPQYAGQALSNLGRLAFKHGQFATASDYWERSLMIGRGGTADVYVNLGVAYARAGSLDAAVDAWKRGLEVDPEEPDLYQNLAEVLISRRQFAEAEGVCQQAIIRLPEHPDAHRQLDRLRRLKGESRTPKRLRPLEAAGGS